MRKYTLLFSGLLIVAFFWITTWTKDIWISEYSFFPLWVGYILTINGLNEALFGKSLLKHFSGKLFVILFAISIPLWWFFEYLNDYIKNWHYILPRQISGIEYFVRASISFSTVVPAVLSTASLMLNFFEKIGCKLEFKPIKVRSIDLVFTFTLGIFSMFLIIYFPGQAFALTWLAPFFVIEPINYILGLPTIIGKFNHGEWLMPIALMTATLFTGFWWELWNFYSMPKWIYTVPYINFWKIFEMPLFGFLGYLPFGLVVYSYTILLLACINKILNKNFSINY